MISSRSLGRKVKSKTKPRLRVLIGSATALGPGKVDLLEAVGRSGSISGAARELNMSYRRAWLLIDTMNRCFKEDLVVTVTGGKGGGGAEITPMAYEIISRYREMEEKAADSVRQELTFFENLLVEGGKRD